ncbi:MAG: hypothetical protein J6K43_06225 [Lachnospiraceae bacterium]|nr:hypothetical protein [Lachnospiraceae bacterium]
MDNSILNDDMMLRYEQLVKEGKIEVFDYDSSNMDTKISFLQKWKELNDSNYNENLLTIYIGERGKRGKFYECYEDFFFPLEGETESELQRLIKEVLKMD